MFKRLRRAGAAIERNGRRCGLHGALALLVLACYMPTLVRSETSREAALSSAVDRLWSALSNEPREAADVATLRELFHSDARILGAGDKGLRIQSIEQFLAAQAQVNDQGFYEREIHRSVQMHDRLAQVFSTVESRAERNAAKPTGVGVNSIQWFWDGSAWRILTLYYQLETPQSPIPEHYRR